MEEEKSKVNNEIVLNSKAISKNKLPDQVLSIEQLLRDGNGTNRDLNYYRQMLSDFASKRREIEAGNTLFCRELKSKIENIMHLNSKAIPISQLLSQILSNAVRFYKEKHFGLIDILIEAIKVLTDSGASLFCKDQTATVLIEIITDFLYRLKDRHPSSNSKKKCLMDVFNMIMEFLIPNGYLPSAALLKEYSESKVNRELSALPSLEYLNSQFGKFSSQMSKKVYELLRKRFESRPPIVFYFNPSIELQVKVKDDYLLMIGFFDKTKGRIGAGMEMDYDGNMHQGYFKDDRCHIYGRFICDDGDIYEGGWDMDKYNGKGEWEYSDGRKEIGHWVEDEKQGEFECYDHSGTLTHTKIYKDGIEIKCEQVKQQI